MTKSDINQIVVDYIRYNLSPTKRERKSISSKYEELKTILKAERTLQNGSYARYTSTTPVNDLDVIYILSEEEYPDIAEAVAVSRDLDVTKILEELAELLREAYPDHVRIEVQPHSVGIFFGNDDEFSIDVVPAIPADNGMFWVPETSRHSIKKRRIIYESKPPFNWIKSDPKGYIKDASDVNERSDGKFRKSTKFIKKWKQGCKEQNPDFPLKSFHLELIVTKFYKANYALECLIGIEKFFNTLPEFIIEPRFPDKADETRNVDEYLNDLSEEERQLVLSLRERAISVLERIYKAETEPEVLNLLDELLIPGDKLKSVNILVGSSLGAERTSPAVSKPYYWQ